MIKVCKFGGTSLSTAENFLRVKEIILSDDSRKIIVVSAPGKRFQGDEKITDLLISLSKDVSNEKLKNQITDRFLEIAIKLNIRLDIKAELNLNGNRPTEYLISRGEYLSAKILSEISGCKFVDATELLRFNLFNKLEKNIRLPALNKGIIVPGFYRLKNGKISLFPRGGSDITASYLARIYNADLYENFTDVSGIFPINPSVEKINVIIDEMDYKDYENLKYLNPKVFEKSAYKPIIGGKTIINIRNTFDFTNKGTFIYPKLNIKKVKYFSIAIKGNTIIISGRNLIEKSAIDTIKKILNDNFDYKIKKVKNRLIFIRVNNKEESLIIQKLAKSLLFST